MAYFETFYVQRITKKGERLYRLTTLDSERVESWEFIDDKHTKVFMKSGNTLLLHVAMEDFSNIIIDNEDAYGKILVFSEN